MDEHDRLTEVFFDVQRGLPRQGIGSNEQTLRALALCSGLPRSVSVLDIGCGPGMQTVALARALSGDVTAVDLYEEFLDQLRESAEAAGLSDRITAVGADMADLPFGRESFDLIWCEGAAYFMGFEEALVGWQSLLRQGGYMAISEIVWTRPDPPPLVFDFYTSQYPGMTDVEGNLERIRNAGCELMGHFTLPEATWWDEYFTPLEAKLPALREKYAGDKEALGVVDAVRQECDIRRRFADTYGYEFFVVRVS